MLLGNNLLSRHLSLLLKYWRRDGRIELQPLSQSICFQDSAGPSPDNPPYLVDRRGIEPRPEACKATVLPLSLSAQILASREGLEPPRTVLETVMLPLHHPDNFNTLFPMCVLKHSKLLRLPVRKECFNTLGFFYVQEHKPSPRPPICNFKVLPARVALHSIKNPGCLVQGLVELVSYFLCVTCTFNRP